MVLSGPPGAGGITAELLDAAFPRLHEAGFETASITAPLSLSVLHDAIREALTEPTGPEAQPAPATGTTQPLVVIVEHAENLLLPTVQRIVALGALRRGGAPVLRFLLAGSEALWPALRAAGLAALEHDPTAHVRLTPKPGSLVPIGPPASAQQATAPQAAAPGGATLPAFVLPEGGAPVAWPRLALPRFGLPKPFLAGAAMACLALAGLELAAWLVPGSAPHVAGPGPLPAASPPSADDRLAVLLRQESRQIAAGQLWSPPGDNLVETRRQVDALIPSLSAQALRKLAEANEQVGSATEAHAAPVPKPARIPVPAPAPAKPILLRQAAPTDAPTHVTVRVGSGDAAATAEASRLLASLRRQGVLADGPVATSQPIEHSGVAFYFAQDQAAADRLAQRLRLPGARIRHAAPGGPMPRPGEVSVSIAPRNAQAAEPDATQTPEAFATIRTGKP